MRNMIRSAWGAGMVAAIVGFIGATVLAQPARRQGPGQGYGSEAYGPGYGSSRPQGRNMRGRRGRPMRRREPMQHLRNQHSAPNTGISSQNVDQLQRIWTIEVGAPVTHKPLVENGRVYFADWSGSVYCADAQSGDLIWRKQVLEQVKSKWPWHGFVGTGALGRGILYEASAAGMVYAIDAHSGDVLWSTSFAQDPHAGSISRLMYHNGMLYIGVTSVEETLSAMKKGFNVNFQGKVVAINTRTGRLVWQGWLASPPHTGAGVWSAFALDPRTGVLYFTTSNNYTGQANELSDAIVAVDARTGRLIWSTQVTEHDVWTRAHPQGPDYAFAAGPQLFRAMINGRMVPLVGAGQKSGVYHVLNRRTGEIVWQTVVGYGGGGGGIHGAASIGGGRVFVWSNNSYAYGKPAKKYPMNVKALDAATGQTIWVRSSAQPASATGAGFLSGDVYFVPSLDGKIRAYSAANGESLWSGSAGGAIASSLWVEDGRLYAAAGLPKAFGGGGQGGSVVAFAPRGGQARNWKAVELGPAIRVIATNFDFNVAARPGDPEPSRIVVQPGEKVRVTLINRAHDTKHNIEFELPGGEVEFEQPVPPGGSRTLVFTAPEQPGEYVIYCPVAHHREKGMVGTLVVRSKQQQNPEQEQRQQQQSQ